MVGTVCNLIPPQYMCYQWTGSNFDDITTTVDTANQSLGISYLAGRWTVRESDQALINTQFGGWVFPLNSWLISSPYYPGGSYTFYVSSNWASGLTPAQFAEQMKAV